MMVLMFNVIYVMQQLILQLVWMLNLHLVV